MQKLTYFPLLLLLIVCRKVSVDKLPGPYCLVNATTAVSVPFDINLKYSTNGEQQSQQTQQSQRELTLVCCAGYRRNHLGVCEPLCERLRCEGMERCVSPEVCACPLRHIRSNNALLCRAICGRTYNWNSNMQRCERRCQLGAAWDSLMQMCVQRLQLQAEVIAQEQDMLLPDLRTIEIEDDNQGLALPAAESVTEYTDNNGAYELPVWLTLWNVLVTLGVCSLLLVVVYVVACLLHRRHNKQIEGLESKRDLDSAYELDRSKILVF